MQNYTLPLLETPQTQYFNARVTAQQYASGGVDSASKGWMIILFLVFIMNIFVLIYFLLHKGLVTDFSEPPNLFALAVNSPPSHTFAGSCGGGPEGKQYMVNWFVNAEGDHLYMEPGLGEKVGLHTHTHEHGPVPHHVHVHPPPPPPPPALKETGAGFFTRASQSFAQLRERGTTVFTKQRDKGQMRPVSVVDRDADFEMEDGAGGSRTQRAYAKLSKRRSVL
jgi:hypothetical protein